MNKYRVIPDNGISYVVSCDFIEVDGDWILFYIMLERKIVHICSSRFTKYMTLVKE